jgi:septal ring factor EnvC (AmiA/AmiB activator)
LDANNVPTKVTITNVVNNYIIEVNTNLQPFVRESTDNAEGSMGNLVFVYGQIVNDYLTVSKDDILSLNVAALQEIDKQLQEEKIKRVDELNQNNNITALEQKLEEQTTRTNQLEKQLEEQTNKMNVFEKQMQELYNKLNVEKSQRFELETKLETYVEIMNSMIINK